MKRNRLSGNSAMWMAVIWGIIICVLFSILGAAIGAVILNSGKTGDSSAKWVVSFVWGISAFCGIMLALKIYKENKLLIAGIIASVYLILLTGVNVMLLDQSFNGFGRGIIALLIGAVLATLINHKKRRRKNRKHRYR